MPRFSIRHAIASYLGDDAACVERRRYQSTRTPCPVYTDGNDYLTATASASRKPRGDGDYVWQKVPDSDGYVAAAGWQIWIADKIT